MTTTDHVRPYALAGVSPAAIAAMTGISHTVVSKITSRLRARGEGVPLILGQRSPAPETNRITTVWDAAATGWILAEIEAAHGITVATIKSANRAVKVVRARQEAMSRLRLELGMSLSGIGRRLNRDHTTVLHGVRRHAVRMAEASK